MTKAALLAGVINDRTRTAFAEQEALLVDHVQGLGSTRPRRPSPATTPKSTTTQLSPQATGGVFGNTFR